MAIDRSTDDFRRTEAIQTSVSDPQLSAWVSANAGSGKTHVLTNRVIRLLMGDGAELKGANPASILCITYTKAAAAEMQARLFRTLGEWALMSNEELQAALAARLGPDVAAPDLSEVRRLFARALDAPGGLRIQTIHAFCESLLSRFPLEAGLLPGFSVLEEAETEDLRQRIASDFAQGVEHAEWREDFLALLDHFGNVAQLMEMLSYRREHEETDEAVILSRLGLKPGADEASIVADALRNVSPAYLSDLEQAHDEFVHEYGDKPRQKFDLQSAVARKIKGASPEELPALFYEAIAAWLTAKKEMPAERTCGGNEFVRARVRDYKAHTLEFCEHLSNAHAQCEGLKILKLNASLIRMRREYEKRYKAFKEARGALDFDDLIEHSAHLVETHHDDWIRFKLDQGISHLLLDEAQDTGARQWAVINSLRDGFWDREPGTHLRTAFVVGDKKQSIYSFQGADARLFEKEKSRMGEATGEHPFEEQTLFLSFRSARTVLDTVDAMFEGDAGSGLYEDERELHAPAKPDLAGQVELWPLFRKPEREDPDLWVLPVDAKGPQHPNRALAEAIAADIEQYVRTGVVTDKEGHARRPTYGDIMILCQRRTGVFPEIVRTLALKGIPNGGTDRVKLLEDVAVQDLSAALRFAVNHEDDLSLAEMLKSPFGRFTEEELFSLAYDRKGRLWAALLSARGETPLGQKAADIVARISAAEEAGRRFGSFAFLSVLLEEGAPTGRYLLRQRLGDASDDALDEIMNEALEFDVKNPRTLNGFLAHLQGLTSDIKKEFGDEADMVRIMTVHGAKGLEAPAVYLADANFKPGARYEDIPLLKDDDEDGVFIRLPSGVAHPAAEAGKDYLKSREMQEYRRKLYVAATRAEQRLVICGTEAGRRSEKTTPDETAASKPPMEASWYGLACQAFDRIEKIEERACGWRDDMPVRLRRGGKPAILKEEAGRDRAADAVTAPDWLFAAVPSEASPTVYFPSSLDEEDDGPVYSPRRSVAAQAGPSPRARGLVIHQLLEILPALPPEAWEGAADRLLSLHAAEETDETRTAWRDEVLAVLRDPAFGDVFGPDGQAEVALRGQLGGRDYAGQVDRLLVSDGKVLVVDYKTMRPPPAMPEAAPQGILRQMAIYRALLVRLFPAHQVEAAILWTYTPQLMPLSPELLDRTLESIG